MLAGLNRLAVEPLVLLHVGQVDHQVELSAREQLVDVRILVGDLELFCLVLRPLGDDVAGAHQFDEGALGEMRQVTVRYAAAADHPDPDALRLRSRFRCPVEQHGSGRAT